MWRQLCRTNRLSARARLTCQWNSYSEVSKMTVKCVIGSTITVLSCCRVMFTSYMHDWLTRPMYRACARSFFPPATCSEWVEWVESVTKATTKVVRTSYERSWCCWFLTPPLAEVTDYFALAWYSVVVWQMDPAQQWSNSDCMAGFIIPSTSLRMFDSTIVLLENEVGSQETAKPLKAKTRHSSFCSTVWQALL